MSMPYFEAMLKSFHGVTRGNILFHVQPLHQSYKSVSRIIVCRILSTEPMKYCDMLSAGAESGTFDCWKFKCIDSLQTLMKRYVLLQYLHSWASDYSMLLFKEYFKLWPTENLNNDSLDIFQYSTATLAGSPSLDFWSFSKPMELQFRTFTSASW